MWSDIDIVICPKEVSETENYDFLDKLNLVLNNNISFVENIKYYNRAKVPIIKIKTTKTYKNTLIDITLQTKQHFGIQCVNLVNQYLQKYESLEILLYPLKTMLKISELNDPYNGGISSYGLILMIVYFLEQEKKKGKNISTDSIGNLFYDFLFFYGGRKDSNYIDLNNESNKILANNPGVFYISDPLNINNNVAKATFKYIEIKLIFLLSLHILNEPCHCQCHYLKNEKELSNYKGQNYLNKIFFALKRGGLNSYLVNGLNN